MMSQQSTYRDAVILHNGMPIVNIGKLISMSRDRTPFGQRMFEARTRAGLTQLDVREALGVSQGTLSELERTAAGSTQTVEYATLYGVSVRWLAGGEGPMDAAAEPPPPAVRPDEVALLRAFRRLISEADRGKVLGYAEALAGRSLVRKTMAELAAEQAAEREAQAASGVHFIERRVTDRLVKAHPRRRADDKKKGA